MRLITNNLTLNSTITASSENIFFPSSNLKNQLRSKKFRSESKSNQWIVFDLGEAKDIDSVVVLLPKENSNYTGNQVIKIQANNSSDFTAPAIDITLDNTKYLQSSYYFSSNQTYRYWRLTVTDPTAPNDYIEIGQVILGKSENLQNAQNGFKFIKNDNTKIQRNDFGTAYADKYPILKQVSLDYNVLYYEEILVIEDIFDRVGSHTAIFVTLDETGDTFNKDHYSIYGLMRNSFTEDHINYRLFNTSGLMITELN